MRVGLLILTSALLILMSCASPRLSSHYSPPSVAPVRQRIADGQTHVAAAVSAAKQARAAVTLQLKDQFIDQLTKELLEAQTALKDSDDRAAQLQNQIILVTDAGNRAIEEKNSAIDKADQAAHRYHRLKFFACLIGAGAALVLVVRLRVLTLVPPPYNFIGVGAVPAIVFGFLWLRL